MCVLTRVTCEYSHLRIESLKFWTNCIQARNVEYLFTSLKGVLEIVKFICMFPIENRSISDVGSCKFTYVINLGVCINIIVVECFTHSSCQAHSKSFLILFFIWKWTFIGLQCRFWKWVLNGIIYKYHSKPYKRKSWKTESELVIWTKYIDGKKLW
jgi:hypothetical protein